MMQRNELEALAALVARWRMLRYSGTCDVLAADLADICAASNPAFNRERFLAATRVMPGAAVTSARPKRITLGGNAPPKD